MIKAPADKKISASHCLIQKSMITDYFLICKFFIKDALNDKKGFKNTGICLCNEEYDCYLCPNDLKDLYVYNYYGKKWIQTI